MFAPRLLDFQKTKFMNHRVPAHKRYQPTEYEHAANCATHAVPAPEWAVSWIEGTPPCLCKRCSVCLEYSPTPPQPRLRNPLGSGSL
uniref:monocyte to macrophage differentiation factor 2 isoform X2 n=1 Tax=Panthera onca TaxID=9690 RepID=UPI002953FEAD|nr:monocyte to macrophage differentiation factor 2 isoform X2 [Panthera onca]